MTPRLIQVVAYSNWIIAVSRCSSVDYECWVLTPEYVALNDEEYYPTVQEAMNAGRLLVLLSTEETP